jgi:hypothetical protein
MVSLDQRHDFEQTFSQAYIARDSSGDADIVLVQDNMQPRHGNPAQPLTPDATVAPRQLVHIRVFWTPMSGVKADHPANTNASIHWRLVFDNPDQPGMVEYAGSGLVLVDDSHDGANVHIRKAWMKAICQRGDIVDPLGPSILEGYFHAANDPAQIQSLLAEIKATSPATPSAPDGHVALAPAN